MDLQRFGFTATESRVYVALLRVSPATGYTVARETGLARANTYGSLETMAARGVVTRLPGRPVRFVAEDPDTLVGRLRRESQRDLEQISRELATVERRRNAPQAPAIELLMDRPAVLDRVAACARSAAGELLAVVGPWAPEVFPVLAGPRRSRVVLRVLSLGSQAPPGALVRAVPESQIESYWGGLPIAVVADRRRAVCAVASAVGATSVATEHPAIVPFVRHLLRRELASAAAQHVL